MNDLAVYMRSQEIVQRFAEIVGGSSNAMAYISSVLLAVANDPSGNLQKCSPQSIYESAIRAASLRLSVDPGIRQAYLVPFKGEATLIVGYKGLYDMAIRTGKYRYINVGKVYEGEEVVEDRLSGIHHISGSRTGDKHIGWIGAFEMTNGFGKTLYMSVEEIHAHAKRYSKGYSLPGGAWKRSTEQMEKKTVLRLLLTWWGYLDPNDLALLSQVEDDDSVVEGEIISPESTIEEPNPEPQPEPVRIERPLQPAALAEALARKAQTHQGEQANSEQRGLLAMLLNIICGGNNETRHSLQKYLFGSESLKDVPDEFILAALDWLKPTQDSGGAYQPDPMAFKEASLVLETLQLPLPLEGESPYPPEDE